MGRTRGEGGGRMIVKGKGAGREEGEDSLRGD